MSDCLGQIPCAHEVNVDSRNHFLALDAAGLIAPLIFCTRSQMLKEAIENMEMKDILDHVCIMMHQLALQLLQLSTCIDISRL